MVELLIFSLLLTNIVGLLCIRSVLKHSNLLAREHGRWDANTPKLSVRALHYQPNSAICAINVLDDSSLICLVLNIVLLLDFLPLLSEMLNFDYRY